ncbi:MAG: glycosyltransferase [Xanthomonadales bacterium]|nr:glycosyltransferase [Xanthomonadales bacterium]
MRPVILHISHDWGGGVARWTADLVAADKTHNHLVLSASGRKDGKIHGQWLKLYAAGPGKTCVREWALAPAIACTQVTHPQYREVLEAIIARYGVARIVVSSLIGHSLDALATGLPTIEMLHDYYPAWPALDQDPLDFVDDAGRIELDRAIDKAGDGFLFAERRAGAWRELGAAWLEAVRNNDVALAAPTEQVLTRWRRLLDVALEQAKVVPHGFSGWPDDAPTVEPRALPDGRLNLVVVGRLSPGKGLGLLEAALPGLREHARITLLGCGHHGMRFFGRPDVDIVLDYRHEDLPLHLARIGAQAVLFLSTVAETWNYVLTETRALGLVPLATRAGSFIERIRHQTDGLLFEPDAGALVEAVASLHNSPRQLETLRDALPAEPPVSEALTALGALAGLREAAPAAASARRPVELQAAAEAAELADARHRNAGMVDKVESLRRDLEKRTDWARKHERLAGERTQWAKRLDAELHDYRQEVSEELGRLELALHSARSEAEANRARAEHLDGELKTIFASRSWRMTRPMRVANRIIANAVRRRIYNPKQWPFLLRRLRLHLRLHGARGTLELLQQGTNVVPKAPAAFETTEAPAGTPKPVVLDPVEKPLVSIVVPVFNKVDYTAACLNSIIECSDRNIAYELIVVDDCSNDETADYLTACRGVRVIRNATNSGFIASCNAGAEAACGHFLVFLNNDTSLTEGWLRALVETFDIFPDTGVVGARLIYPNGKLQEAGGIIFKDGSGWNYGRDDRPDRPEYSFASEADYVSGACLAIERNLFAHLGGFDRHYSPAYYEDTDLCFRVREAGRRVIYQPACTIVHHEGVSSGTDESSGTKRFQAVNRKKFEQRWRRQLQQHTDPVPGPEAVHRIRYRRLDGHILVVDATTPEPDKDSGSMRMVAILTILREMGFRVSFMPQNLAWVEAHSRMLQARGIEVLHHPWVNAPETWLAQQGSQLTHVIVSRYYVLESLIDTIRKHARQASLVFDTVDLHFLREERLAELSGSEKARHTAQGTRQSELALIRRSDTTLVVSPIEKALLDDLVPEARIQVLSNIHRLHGSGRPWSQRRDLLFVGGFQHPPNVDAAKWLIEEIMPLARERLPELKLHIIGSRMPEGLREHRSEGVVMHGYVEDLAPYLEGCRLSVAPLRYGAGVKGKVNQAMAWGLPVVATGCAAEGMYLEDGEDVLVADTTEAFVEAVVRAYTDESLWEKLSEGGLANVEKHFSFDAARRAIVELMKPENQKTL